MLEELKRAIVNPKRIWKKTIYSIKIECLWGYAHHLCSSYNVCPSCLGRLIGNNEVGQWIQVNFSDIFGLWYNIVFGLLIIIFTFFYTAITVPTNKMSDDLKRSGGFVPGIRPGNETSEFLDNVMSQITFPGSLFLAALAVFPAIVVKLMGMQQGWALFYGGTSLLIMVGVAIDTIQQVNSYLLNRHYDGLMKTSRNRKITI